ncbi:K+-transporting ATPase, A subunit [Methylococcus capsulatus str. Bath]|uniref:Potassium-transporting ATPase potassium-binding subunit n=1 Tax=Methylococcus capsulatus (strain ATCC 33009 / NCIMB 11132 / Bath) TaxID=243233 RepID=KDPA_METCA|nr:potassium-transporting ATPase subunit KdpA [Methylococcus capsulatus]Q605R1.1 RecName: Full=Potassium-transporting ATPase potassium-binding subunit; AltName: Full=ATP phosphohydrolase [potassium-transporting] A chain; AltName: Full=Potassium-binding and translocating subunit A; AltName: Full=Potassium-translocating ATPase A chain [Methylococcus capsulatus str. Bath]AAU91816.1 K+-transporting ATPase, A subunit [Methylococcus capsulatus str. Bath]
MTANGLLQICGYLGVLLALAKPLGSYMAAVYEGRSATVRVLASVERFIYRITGIDPEAEMRWTGYASAFLVFNLLGVLAVYALQRCQGFLPLNPQGLPAVAPDSAFNTAISFATNTNWQGYGGEMTLSHLTQMLGLTVQNFVSAASGMAVLVALIRGFVRRNADTLGNFWVDLTRSILHILLPLSFLLALLLIGQGVVQTFEPYRNVTLVEATGYDRPKQDEGGHPLVDADGNPVTEHVTVSEQTLALGPAASQVAIKQLGTNGGGFFSVNSAHPFENPTPFSNFLEMLAILVISGALCHTFGVMVGDTRQGWVILAAMTLIFVPLLFVTVLCEQGGNPAFAALGVDPAGGNMEGKETRFGIVNSALWATATTAASNGSVNAMHDSFTPLGGLVPMWLMQLGEVVFGGVGSGLYGMLVFAIVAVFVAGLMIGRTPEYLGKKIEAYEMKMAAIVILVPPLMVLGGTAVAVMLDAGKSSVFNPGAHGFSEILYAFSSAGNNNGSAFAGLAANTPFYNLMLGLAMWFSRYWLAVPVLAIAGALAAKNYVPPGAGTLPTHTPMFVGLLVGVVIIVGALTFIPALALGPIVEHLMMIGAR